MGATGSIQSASTPADPQPGLEYVNLGDSFSAGSGISPIAPGQEPKCWQSEQNFSHIVAAQLGYRLTDVSCGGADTNAFYRAQHEGMRPQIESLSPTTDLVTLMIGGNNHDTFSGAMATCVEAMVKHPGAFEPCRAQHGTSLTDPIANQTYPALVTALHDIHAKAPHASGGCPLQMPVHPNTDGERVLADQVMAAIGQ